MNDIFNSKRFVAYAAQHVMEKGWTYGILTAGMFLLSVAVNYIIFIATRDTVDPRWLFVIAGVIMGVITIIVAVELSMGDFRRRSTRIMSHMIPSSDMEKFLFAIINAFFFWLVYVAIFYLSLFVLHVSFDAPLDITATASRMWNSSWVISNIFIALFVLSVSIFSNTITRRSPLPGYLITLGGMVCLYILFYLPKWTGFVNDSSGMDFIPYLSIEPYLKNGDGSMRFYVSRIPYDLKSVVESIFMLSAIFIFLVTGYHKFKERELK